MTIPSFDLASAFARLTASGIVPGKSLPGRPSIGLIPADEEQTPAARQRRQRVRDATCRADRIAILDMETDPFDKSQPDTRIAPFLCVLYSDDWQPIIIWDDDERTFYDRVFSAIEGLPERYTIYAHNGGKFDFLFLLHRLRGEVQFKGRGLMCAEIGQHKLRDSFLIIPEKLASYKKTAFDYNRLKRQSRDKYRQEIIDYCIDDCRDLLEIVKAFVAEHGMKLTIGQAAMAALKKKYRFATLGPNMDAYMRNFFFGGRVECLQGRGVFNAKSNKTLKLYDINSAYPHAMASRLHPIGGRYSPRKGLPTEATVFLDIDATNVGALVRRDANGETTARNVHGNFRVSIWEFETATRLGLIKDVKINWCIDNDQRSDFREFIEPLYSGRLLTKAALRDMRTQGISEGNPEFDRTKQRDIILKLTQNNAYGKFAQNPRRFKECYISAPGERPSEDDYGLLPAYECDRYAIWERPNPGTRFSNVGTAASITGAVRATLMEALHSAENAVYCDTDSIICEHLSGVPISETELGAWAVEAEFRSVLIAGKKLYAAIPVNVSDCSDPKVKVRSKGAQGLKWNDLEQMLDGEIIAITNPAPTFTRRDVQHYMTRRIRATAPLFDIVNKGARA